MTVITTRNLRQRVFNAIELFIFKQKIFKIDDHYFGLFHHFVLQYIVERPALNSEM